MAQQNRLLATLDIKTSDRVISIKESGNVDSNFIITHLINQILQEDGKICLVILHNTLGHYHNVGKKLGYDFLKRVQEGAVKTIEPLKDIVDDLDNPKDYLILDKEHIVKRLFTNIQNCVNELVAKNNQKVYLIIDDISHLLDLGVDISLIVNFTNYCLGLVSDNNDRVAIVINTHVSGKTDEIICNNLNYVSDVAVEILPLKTGFSREVTGVISVEKAGGVNVSKYHYKAYDRGIKTFHLGESIYNLYK